jgi:TonB family protein
MIRPTAAWRHIIGAVVLTAAGGAASDITAQVRLEPLLEWTVVRGKSDVQIDGGVLRVRGGGWARSDKPVVDFVLRFEARAVTPGAEGTILLRAFSAFNGRPVTGYRVTLGPRGRTVQLRGISAAADPVPLQLPSDTEPLRDTWNAYEIRAEANRVIVLSAGEPAAIVDGHEPAAGYIGFEGATGTVEYRNVVLGNLRTGACEQFSAQYGVPRLSEMPPLGIQPPRLLREVKPQYSRDTMRSRVQGVVMMEATVQTDGTLGDICVSGSVDPALDAEAVAALRQWRFHPALQGDRPLPVRITVSTSYGLR